MCPVIAKVIATFSIVFQNEANLNLSFRKKSIFFYIGRRGEWEEPEGGDNDGMATEALTAEEEFKSSQRGLLLGMEGGALGSHCREPSIPQGLTPALWLFC